MSVNPFKVVLLSGIFHFLTNQIQHVRVNYTLSDFVCEGQVSDG